MTLNLQNLPGQNDVQFVLDNLGVHLSKDFARKSVFNHPSDDIPCLMENGCG